jgi:hypothetical protein
MEPISACACASGTFYALFIRVLSVKVSGKIVPATMAAVATGRASERERNVLNGIKNASILQHGINHVHAHTHTRIVRLNSRTHNYYYYPLD